MKYRFKTKPYDHQKKALVRFFKKHFLAVLWEPGLGKTKFVVDAACAGYQMGRIERVLVVCPMSVLGVWEDEFELHATTDYYITVLSRKDTRIDFQLADGLNILVVNYDLAWRRKDLIKKWNPQFVVADESQKIKKPSTKRSWYMRSLNKAPYRAILTGTPNPRGFIDLYGQWVFLNPKRFGTKIEDFKERYVVYGGFKGYVIKGYRHKQEIKDKVRKDATVRRKDDTLDLPERVWQRVPLDLEPQARKLYDRLEEDFWYTFGDGAEVEIKMALNKMQKLQQITGGFINTSDGWRQVSNVKFEALADQAEVVYDMEDKIVVIARLLPEIDQIYRILKKQGFQMHVIKGGVTREERDRARRDFQTTRRPAAMVLQIQSGGLGITLHSANLAWFHSTTLALDDYIQACDRIHRSGQTRKVTYRHAVCRSTVDIDIYRSLKDKKKVMDYIMSRNSALTRRHQGGNNDHNERG